MARNITDLRRRFGRVFVVGRSIGATIGVDLAAQGLVDGVVLINPFVFLKRHGSIKPESLYTFGRILTPYVPVLLSLNMSRPDTRHLALRYSWVPTSSGPLLSEYAWTVHLKAKGISTPALIITSSRDQIVDPSSSDVLAESFVADRVRRIVLPRSGHVAVLDWDGPQVVEAVTGFLQELGSSRLP
jgi:carboxylesterase